MRNYHSVIAGTVLLGLASIPAYAQTELTGKWIGTFNGVQVDFPSQRDIFGQTVDEVKKGQSPPKFVENTLQLDIDTQRNGLAVGIWKAGEFTQRFVCAQISPAVWHCVDAGGQANLEVKSATEIKVCYFDNREGAQGAGCGLLKKAQ